MTELLSVSVAIIAGLLLTRVVKPLHLPDVTAFLVTGVLIGPYCLGALGIPGLGFNTMEEIDVLTPVSNAALGFIAFAIGNEFRLSELKKTGKAAAVIGVLQALVAAFVTGISLMVLHIFIPEKMTIPVVLTLAAIATATAPAATLMVVRQYKAKGELTDLLLPIVALDDAVGLVVFAVCFGIAKAIQSGNVQLSAIIFEPLLEIVLSLVLGALLGLLLTELEKHFFSNANRMSMTIGFVLLTVAVSYLEFTVFGLNISFSSLLVCMMLGTVFCNTSSLSNDLMERADTWTAPLYVFFFVISGAGLELSVFSDLSVVLIGLTFVIMRAVGKYVGAYSGCVLMKQDKKVTQNLGIALFPQAGVALGMCVLAMQLGGSEGELIRNIVLFAVLVYELVGPSLTKDALIRSGDIVAQSAGDVGKREKLKVKVNGKAR